MNLSTQRRTWLLLSILIILSLALHVLAAQVLNIVEDESAYLQDAAQIRANILPFREFGATKGPLFLFLLSGWEKLFTPSIFGPRLLSILAHLASIPLLYRFATTIMPSRTAALASATLWALTPAAVSLTTNVMHAPLEILLVMSALCLIARPSKPLYIVGAALLYYLAFITRATAIAFAPLFLYFLLHRDTKVFLPAKKQVWYIPTIFCVTWLSALMITLAIVYPLYGWPKTAFFFNADATLIANQQRAVYAQAQETNTPLQFLFAAGIPLWREGLALILATLALPFLAARGTTARSIASLVFIGLSITLGRALVSDAQQFPFQPFIVGFLLVCSAIIVLTMLIVPKDGKSVPQKLLAILTLWVGGVAVFYWFWGRTPTPFYVLEAIPAFALAAGFFVVQSAHYAHSLPQVPRLVLKVLLALFILTGTIIPYSTIKERQYRGTTEVNAAREMAHHIRSHIPVGEPLFTGQPVFAYLSEHPLYGYYTHPGWYLAERAGFLSPALREVFMPPFEQLAQNVARDVNWIVVDWRTWDVYFNENTAATLPFRELLARHFEPVVTIQNNAARPITLYRRVSSSPTR